MNSFFRDMLAYFILCFTSLALGQLRIFQKNIIYLAAVLTIICNLPIVYFVLRNRLAAFNRQLRLKILLHLEKVSSKNRMQKYLDKKKNLRGWKERPANKLTKLGWRIFYGISIVLGIIPLFADTSSPDFLFESRTGPSPKFIFIVLMIIILLHRLARSYLDGSLALWETRNNLLDNWIKGLDCPPKPLYKISSNYIDRGLSTFDRDLSDNKVISFIMIDNTEEELLKYYSHYYLHSALSGKESFDPKDIEVIKNFIANEANYNKYSVNWLYLWASRHYFLLDPSKPMTKEVINKFFQSFKIPHLNCIVLLVNSTVHESWKEYIRYFRKHNLIKSVRYDDVNTYTSIDRLLDIHPEVDEKIVPKCLLEMDTMYHGTYFNLKSMPDYFYAFFKGAINKTKYEHAVNQLFEFSNMVLRMYCYYFKVLNHGITTENIKIEKSLSRYLDMADCIIQEVKIQGEDQKLLKGLRLGHNKDFLKDYKQFLETFINVELVPSDTINFRGVVHLLSELRNKTKGHGVLTDEVASRIYPLMFKLTLLIIHSLDTMSFRIDTMENDKLIVGFDEKLVNIYPFAKSNKEGDFILLNETNNKKLSYLNYDSGQYFKPDINEIDLPSSV